MIYCESCGTYWDEGLTHICVRPIPIQEQIFCIKDHIARLEERIKYLEQRVIGDPKDE
jgi:hypothetical protein